MITQTNLTSRAIDIPIDMELKIVLNGENTIDVATNGFFAGANSNITFSGDGSLTIKSDYAPFVSNSDITIDGATLKVFNENDGAIQVDGTLTIQNGAYIEANGQYYGVQAGSLSITTGSELTATSIQDMCNPILVLNGDLGISDSTVSGKGYYPIMAVGNITITNSTVVAEASADFGIYSRNDLLIKGNSDVTAKGAAAIGAENSFKLEPPEGGLIDVFVGASENEAQPIENSPLSQSTDLSNYGNNNVKYFRSTPHEHVYDQRVVSDTYKASNATCTESAEYYYSCTCGKAGTESFSDGTPLGHSYDEPEWNWSDDGKTCTVTFTCANDETHKESPEVKITSTVKTPATCTETGVTTYTAAVEFNGQTYTDTKDVADIPAIGHSYEDGKCTVCGAADPNYKPTESGNENPDSSETDNNTQSPQTGDNSNMMLWIAVLLVAGAALTGTVLYSRKRKYSK